MWRSTLYRQLMSSRAAGGPAPALNRCARARHRVFRPRPASMLHADVRTNIHSLSHLTPLSHSPGAQARRSLHYTPYLYRSSVRKVRPVRRRRSRPYGGGDGPKTTLSHRCDIRIGVRLRYVARSARLAGRLTTWGQTTCHLDDLSTPGAPPVLVPGGGKSSRLCCPSA